MIDFLKGTVTPKDWGAVAVILGIAAALAVGFYTLLHQKSIEQMVMIEASTQTVQNDLQQARAIAAKIETLKAETQKIHALVRDFEERLPSEREIVRLLQDFERMAREENLDIELAPLQRERDQTKETIPYNVTVRGNFHQVASFVNELERFKRYLKITDLTLGGFEKGKVTARFKLNTYRFIKPTGTVS